MATTVGDVAIRVGADIGPLQRNMRKGGNSLDDFGRKVKSGAALAAKLGVAVAAAGVAVAAFSKQMADSARELQAQATAANTSIKRFQSLAFAAKSVGIEQDKLADILKDVNDRVGDFNATGGGPMADFFENIAPKVGVTADQFARLSGPESLQLYIKSLNDANLSQADMTFYMEAIASDSTRLLSLYKDNGRQLENLTSQYDKVNASLALSAQQSEDLNKLAGTFDLLGSTAKNAAMQVVSNLAPSMEEFVTKASESVPILTNHLIDFLNSFKDASDIVQIEQLERQIEDVNEKIAETEQQQLSSAKSFEQLDEAMRDSAEFQLAFAQSSKDRADQANESQQEYNESLLAYKARLEELQTALANLKEEEADGGRANLFDFSGTGIATTDDDEAIEAQKESQERSLHAYQQYYNRRIDAAQRAADAEAAIEAANRKTIMSEASMAMGRLSSLMESEHKGMFEIGKAAAISQTVIDTYAAAQSSYKALAGIPIVGPGLGAAAAAAAIAGGISRVNAISSRSFSKSGAGADPGAGAGAGVGGGAAQQSAPTQRNVNLNLSLVGDSFSRQQVMGLGRDMVEEINNALDDGAILRVT